MVGCCKLNALLQSLKQWSLPSVITEPHALVIALQTVQLLIYTRLRLSLLVTFYNSFCLPTIVDPASYFFLALGDEWAIKKERTWFVTQSSFATGIMRCVAFIQCEILYQFIEIYIY